MCFLEYPFARPVFEYSGSNDQYSSLKQLREFAFGANELHQPDPRTTVEYGKHLNSSVGQTRQSRKLSYLMPLTEFRELAL